MLKKIILAFILLYLSYAIGKLSVSYYKVYLSHVEAEKQVALEIERQEKLNKMSVPELIEFVAPKNAKDLKKVAFCESSYRPTAVGDGGRAKGILQFHKPTFDGYEKKYGEDLNYESSYDQIKLADKMFDDGLEYHWSCSKKVGIL